MHRKNGAVGAFFDREGPRMNPKDGQTLEAIEEQVRTQGAARIDGLEREWFQSPQQPQQQEPLQQQQQHHQQLCQALGLPPNTPAKDAAMQGLQSNDLETVRKAISVAGDANLRQILASTLFQSGEQRLR